MGDLGSWEEGETCENKLHDEVEESQGQEEGHVLPLGHLKDGPCKHVILVNPVAEHSNGALPLLLHIEEPQRDPERLSYRQVFIHVWCQQW